MIRLSKAQCGNPNLIGGECTLIQRGQITTDPVLSRLNRYSQRKMKPTIAKTIECIACESSLTL